MPVAFKAAAERAGSVDKAKVRDEIEKTTAFVGTGGRALSFIEPVATTYRDNNEIVGLCDLSPARMRYYLKLSLPNRNSNYSSPSSGRCRTPRRSSQR